MLWACPVFGANQVAFVVGINTYDKLPEYQQLTRAVNDADAVSKEFRKLGFGVTYKNDLRRPEFNAAWQTFVDNIEEGDTAAVFFSGHGIEIEGENFILPRDIPFIKYGRQKQQKRESISVPDLMLDLRSRNPKIILMILDACLGA